MVEQHNHKDFIHHQKSPVLNSVREIVFGAEDGMVSTLGALTGIAVGTQNHFTVVLAGFVIVAVESISMAVGSYLSAKSVTDLNQRKLHEERHELNEYPDAEKKELVAMYIRDGWPKTMARSMAETASKDKHLFLTEMAYRELHISSGAMENPTRNALFMLFSYIFGGMIPIVPYLFLPINNGMMVSITATLLGLFILGVMTTRFTKRTWWKAGLEMLGLASLAAIVGYAIGRLVDPFINL